MRDDVDLESGRSLSAFALGAAPYGFSTDDVRRMIEAGIVPPDARIELINGELIEVAPRFHGHELMKAVLIEHLSPLLKGKYRLFVEATLFLDAKTFVDPDLHALPLGLISHEAKGSDVLLAIEVADSSLAIDLGIKAKKYAAAGVEHLWVVDAARQVTHVHTEPGSSGYREIHQVPRRDTLTLPFMRSARFSLADLLAT